ncbi:MAG: ABC transporter ATP-binding protein [Thermofilum sp.]|jgi:branched-chain amino acid transport system ATP-binding protein|nr:ABC transporter ATP-binding protein [Thermofilum sp.]
MEIMVVKCLSAGYESMRVINDVSFGVEEGEIFAVVGPNGSGKSTLLKALFGLAKVFSGQVFFNGHDITKLPSFKRIKCGLGYLAQTGNVFENLTVWENLLLAGYEYSGDHFDERLEAVLDFLPEIRSFMSRRVASLSGGERQMVALAMILLKTPTMLMFDEPTAALAPKIAASVFDRVVRLNEESGITVLLVEQNTRKALELAERALLLVSGSVRFYGSAEDLLNHKDLLSMYLGL